MTNRERERQFDGLLWLVGIRPSDHPKGRVFRDPKRNDRFLDTYLDLELAWTYRQQDEILKRMGEL